MADNASSNNKIQDNITTNKSFIVDAITEDSENLKGADLWIKQQVLNQVESHAKHWIEPPILKKKKKKLLIIFFSSLICIFFKLKFFSIWITQILAPKYEIKIS